MIYPHINQTIKPYVNRCLYHKVFPQPSFSWWIISTQCSPVILTCTTSSPSRYFFSRSRSQSHNEELCRSKTGWGRDRETLRERRGAEGEQGPGCWCWPMKRRKLERSRRRRRRRRRSVRGGEKQRKGSGGYYEWRRPSRQWWTLLLWTWETSENAKDFFFSLPGALIFLPYLKHWSYFFFLIVGFGRQQLGACWGRRCGDIMSIAGQGERKRDREEEGGRERRGEERRGVGYHQSSWGCLLFLETGLISGPCADPPPAHRAHLLPAQLSRPRARIACLARSAPELFAFFFSFLPSFFFFFFFFLLVSPQFRNLMMRGRGGGSQIVHRGCENPFFLLMLLW